MSIRLKIPKDEPETKEVEQVDRLSWIAENLKIIDKESRLLNLEPNIGQLMLHNSMQLQRLRNLPVRICLLKPRQVGWSTWCVADSFCDVYNTPNVRAMEISADDDATDALFAMATIFKDELPDHMKRPTDYSNKKEIVFSAPHRSSMSAQTAGKVVLGRGKTIKKVHCSEVAFWRNAAQQLGGLYQVVPNTADSSIVLESTAFGIGGAFHDTFWQAVDRLKKKPDDYSGFIPVFFAWYQFPEYKAFIPEGITVSPDDEEQEMIARWKLTSEQIYWRRLKIAEMNGDVSLFRQEYPATAREAFQTSGRSVFPQTWIDKWMAKTTTGRSVLFDRTNDGIRTRDISRSTECWKIWSMPKKGHQYALGIDTMEGRLSDKDNPRSKEDFHGAVMFDRTSHQVVAHYHGRCDQHDIGPQCVMAAEFYNMAWVAVELPNGKTVLDYFRFSNYPNLYRKQKHDLQDIESDTDDYGWRTTTITRPWMVDGIIGVIRDGDLIVYSAELLGEMRTFVRDKTGKAIHISGEHDDLLFGLMIAIQVHIRCPLDATSYPFSHVGESEKVKRQDLAVVGAVDNFEDMNLEEDLVGAYTI